MNVIFQFLVWSVLSQYSRINEMIVSVSKASVFSDESFGTELSGG